LEVVKSFAKHVALPKEGFIEYVKHMKYPAIMLARIHAPTASPILSIKAAKTNDFVESHPFPNKVRDNLLTYISNKSARRKCTPYEQIEMKPEIFIIKELNEENLHEVYLCDDAMKVTKGNTTRVGKPIISCAIGTSSYHGLCDIGASISVIPHTMYLEIKSDIDPIEMEETGMTIQLANKEYISPLGTVRDVGLLDGKIKYLADFIVLGCFQELFCPIIFGRPFLHTVGARIDLPKERVYIKCDGEELSFNFSKFTDKHLDTELHVKDQVETFACVVVASSDVVERYLQSQEEPFTHEQKEALEQELAQQPPFSQLRIPPNNLGKIPPPKGDPSFELKPLPDDLKYAYLDEKNIYPIIISANLLAEEEVRLLDVLKAHRLAIGYSLDDLKGISPALCMHNINLEEDAKHVVDYQHSLNPLLIVSG
jgi:hypothetical protein